MSRTLSRRSFLGRSAAVAAGFAAPLVLPATALGRGGRPAPSERIALGFIGLGGMGSGHLDRLLRNRGVEVVALCDVDAGRRAEASAKVRPGGFATHDYRELLARDDVDAVVIATPDHWHALASIHACQAGKDVYCEKPLTLTIGEALEVTRVVRRFGRIFQTGSQQRSSGEFRRACELVRSGRIGRVERAEVGIAPGPQGESAPNADPPPGLDWEMWLGPAPWVPFNPLRHPYSFRWFWDHSGGKVTDWGAHHLDIVQWGFGTDGSGPVAIEGRATFPDHGLFETAVDFEATFTWDDGRKAVLASRGRGVRFVGSEGWVHVDRGFLETQPASLARAPLGRDAVRLERSDDHHENWLDGVRTRRLPICDVEIGAGSVILCHLANIALRTGRPLRWDPSAHRFVDDPAADRWIERVYRAPWRT